MNDESTKSNWTVQQCHRNWISFIETLYDLLDSKSLEELAIHFDIGAAGGAIPEELREIVHNALELIKELRDAGADRNQVMTYFTRGSKGRHRL
jgi:hypothetical protein